MIPGRKKKRPSKKKGPDLRQTTCDHCGHIHYVMSGGWVVNGLGQTLCHSERRNCFDEMRKLRAEARRGDPEFVLSLDE